MHFHAQGFEQFYVTEANMQEEQPFLKRVKSTHATRIQGDASIIPSHVIYKTKTGDDNCLRLKARTAPHVKEDSLHLTMKTVCFSCPPVGIPLKTVCSSCPPVGIPLVLASASL